MKKVHDDETDAIYPPTSGLSTGGPARARTSVAAHLPALTVAPNATESARMRHVPENYAETCSPPRWNTLEFYVYYLVFIVAIPYMVYVPMRLSDENQTPSVAEYEHMLKPGWMLGRRVDDSDIQYRTFRENLPLIAALMVVYAAISWLVTAAAARASQATRRALRVSFLAVMSTVFLVALHGTQAAKVLLLALGNYALVHVAEHALPPRAMVPLVFAYNCAALIVVFYTDGVPYGKLHPSLTWLDEQSGLLPRWYINFNFSMLRLISFSCDYHWAVRTAAADTQGLAARAHGAAGTRPDPPPAFAPPETCPDARERTRQPRSIGDYSLGNYLLYVFYPPLFIAGPVITFNDFCAQLHHPLHIGIGTMARYAVRVAACVLVMEFVLHFMYVNAIKNARAWLGDSPMELSMIGFWNLIFVWLKLLIPWRLFRLWSLLDGVDAPENMIRCMANNYSALAFWRSWHRSYNLWVVRYIYIPVGGARNLLPAVLLVFTFVALWHDLSFTLLTWAWLVTLFIAPEVLATYLLPARRFGRHTWYRHVCAIGAVGNILMMMTANLVGFVVGTEGVQYIWRELTAGWYGVRFLLVASACLFVGAQVMCVYFFLNRGADRRFEYREEEKRQAIVRKC